MTHHYYEKRLEEDLTKIRGSVQEIAGLVETGIRNALHALLESDVKLAYETILADLPINRRARRLDRLCHYFVARHLPSAGHLRFISSVMRLGIELERIGDYAVTICRETVNLEEPLEPVVRPLAEKIGEDVLQMFRQSAEAFLSGNPKLAEATMSYSDQIGEACQAAFGELISDEPSRTRSLSDLFASLMIFSRLNRMASQSKNICEEAVFAATGARKKPKSYRILFLDERNEVLGPMAVSIARKAFPNSGEYSTAGRNPAPCLDPRFIDFMERHGSEIRGEKPREERWAAEELERFHVIVGLDCRVKNHLREVPFRTVALDWQFEEPRVSEGDDAGGFEEIYKEMVVRIRDLMETLRGREAS